MSPLANNLRIFIIIPCYNEAETIAQVVRRAKDYGQVVVIDDGSVDNSASLAKEGGAVVLSHFINLGMGAALETGDSYALKNYADLVVHFDADGQHQAEEIPELVKAIVDGGFDVVLGSRFLKNNDQVPFFKKWLLLKPAIIFQNWLFRIKLTDAHNGFRALSKKALSKIKISQAGMAHGSEIIEQIKLNGLSYREVPVTIIYREFGQGFAGGLKILRDLIFGKINK